LTVSEVLRAEYRSQGWVGVVAAGFAGDGGRRLWRLAGGFSDLEAGRAASWHDRMLAGSITKLLTATAALQLIGEGALRLDESANTYLRRLKLADERVTIRHLLTHTGGVSSDFEHFADAAPDSPATVLGDVVKVDFEPGTSRVYSNGGYTVLGEVIAGACASDIPRVLTERVLGPLGMSSSSLATIWPDDVGPGYEVTDGRAEAVARKVPSVPAAGGLCTTLEDLAHFVAGWRGLLPAGLAEEALSPQAERDGGGHQGFGWLLARSDAGPIVGHGGGVLGFSSSLLWMPESGLCSILMTNRVGAAEAANLKLLQAIGADVVW